MMTIREWATQHKKPLQRAGTWAGLSVALAVLFFMLTLANFNGYYSVLQRLPLGRAWDYLTAHQRSVTAFHRLKIIWPLLCIVTLVIAVRELLRPSNSDDSRPVGFWGRIVTAATMVVGVTYFTLAMVTAVGNFPSGQTLLTGFPGQTFDRIFVRNGQIDDHIALAVSLWTALWIGVVIWTIVFVVRDVRQYIHKRRS